MKVIGAFIQVFHFKLEEIKGYFILGWATKKSMKLAPTGLQALELIFSPVTIEKIVIFTTITLMNRLFLIIVSMITDVNTFKLVTSQVNFFQFNRSPLSNFGICHQFYLQCSIYYNAKQIKTKSRTVLSSRCERNQRLCKVV